MRTVTYKSVIDRIAGYMGEADGLTVEEAVLANLKLNFFVRLAWEHFWWPEFMEIEARGVTGPYRALELGNTQSYRGSYALGNGVSGGTVTGLGLEFTPSWVHLQVRREMADLTIRAWGITDTVSSDGFAFELDTATDNANYVLDYELGVSLGTMAEAAGTGVMRGSFALGTERTLESMDLPFVPAGARMELLRPAGGEDAAVYVHEDTLTTDGWDFEVTNEPDDVTDYTVMWECWFPATEVVAKRARGSQALGSGVSSGSVSGLGLSWTPTWAMLTVMKPAVGTGVGAWSITTNLSASGFGFELDAVTGETGHVLAYELGVTGNQEGIPVGEIKAIWDKDPRRTKYAARVGGGRGPDFHLRGGYVQVLGTAETVYVEYRRRAPVFTGATRSETATYVAGDERYDTTTGDYWIANQAVAAGESPTSTPGKWDRVEFPYVLAEFAAQSVYAMLTNREQQEPEDFTVEMTAGYPLLAAEMDKVERQQGQTRQLRMASSRGW